MIGHTVQTVIDYSLWMVRLNSSNTEEQPISLELDTYKTNIVFKNSVEAGPYVKCEGIVWEETPIWKGSVLLLTKPNERPPYLNLSDTMVTPQHVLDVGDKRYWRYQIQIELTDEYGYRKYSLADRKFKLYMASSEGLCKVRLIDNEKNKNERDKSDDSSSDDVFFSGFVDEKTALDVIQFSSSFFEGLVKIPEVHSWVTMKDREVQASTTMSDQTRAKVIEFYSSNYVKLFNSKIEEVTPYIAISGGMSAIERHIDKDLWALPFINEIRNIETLFRNVFFHHHAESTNAEESSMPYTLLHLNKMLWLSLDVNVVRTKDKLMRNRTWRALFSELLRYSTSGVHHLCININIPLVVERGGDSEANTTKGWHSYFNILSYFTKQSCLYFWQIDEFLKALQEFQKEKSVNVTIFTHYPEHNKIYLLEVLEPGKEGISEEGGLIPISDKLSLINDFPIPDSKNLTIELKLGDDLDVSDSEFVISIPSYFDYTKGFSLTSKEQGNWSKHLWPFKKEKANFSGNYF